MKRFGKRPDDQRGSVTVFVALLLPTLMVMVFLALNIGQLVFEKLRLQNTADACALSAAAVQAAGLNEIAEVNFWSQDYVLSIARAVMAWSETVIPWKDEKAANEAVRYYKRVFRALRQYQDEANVSYARQAMRIAKATKKANCDDIGLTSVRMESINPGSSLEEPGRLMQYKTYSRTVSYRYISSFRSLRCNYTTGLAWSDLMAGPDDHFCSHMGASPVGVCGVHTQHGSAAFDYKISKKSSPMTYAAFKLTQQSKDFVMAASIFGLMQKLEAYAAAMPTRGDVKKGQPQYIPVLVRLNRLDPRPGVPDLDNVLH
ncbi:hypothetical protein DVDV_0580 [Desulfovibrio sp. DV]|uniref:TadE/TadG family type IV pilus assembly protein n=1 Tax=Desulfovibrio sp. DV TaxID=1844708 RepID=UPI00094B843F|nr:Tad domain-containing protein [Desulfovibrio sp. DV]OLN30380.1 hypothetical protein DVDV_0580 [Desulfovibrio sp. DV]